MMFLKDGRAREGLFKTLLMSVIFMFTLTACGLFGSAGPDESLTPPPGRSAVPADPDGIERINFSAIDPKASRVQFASGGTGLTLTGALTSGYSVPRRYVLLEARLEGANGEILATRKAYANFVLSEAELRKMSAEEVRSRVQSAPEKNGAALTAPFGREIPFQFIFEELPKGVVGYQISVVKSVAAK